MAKKKTYVPIANIGDLTSLVNHNCDVLERRIKKLAKSNRSLKVLYIIMAGYMIHTAIEVRKQEEQLYQLSLKVKKLDGDEGE